MLILQQFNTQHRPLLFKRQTIFIYITFKMNNHDALKLCVFIFQTDLQDNSIRTDLRSKVTAASIDDDRQRVSERERGEKMLNKTIEFCEWNLGNERVFALYFSLPLSFVHLMRLYVLDRSHATHLFVAITLRATKKGRFNYCDQISRNILGWVTENVTKFLFYLNWENKIVVKCVKSSFMKVFNDSLRKIMHTP
jgi:hypothetical protein